MSIETFPFESVWNATRPANGATRSIVAFVRWLERRLGGRFVYDSWSIPYGRLDLLQLFELAELFRKHGVLKTYSRPPALYDEPPIKQWRAECGTDRVHITGGMSTSNDHDALIATLAETLERYIWFDMDDYFVSPRTETAASIARVGPLLSPTRFAGFSATQRERNKKLALQPDAEYLWIKGHSWTSNAPVWMPAQVVSGLHGSRVFRKEIEPLILTPITTGLATGPTREFALLNGALEIIERDAFMITWMNQLTPPRINLAELRKNSESLDRLLTMCAQYRLDADVVALPSDVPAYTMCAVVRDAMGGPEIAVGLKAHRQLAHAAEGALMEALRIRHTIRFRQARGDRDALIEGHKIHHLERAGYWAAGGRYSKMNFLTAGEVQLAYAEWEHDSLEQHLERILAWCRKKGYEFASVDLGASKKNVSPWHVHMVVMPEMQPIHQDEYLQYLGGERYEMVPRAFGYTPREELYTDEPHPFA